MANDATIAAVFSLVLQMEDNLSGFHDTLTGFLEKKGLDGTDPRIIGVLLALLSRRYLELHPPILKADDAVNFISFEEAVSLVKQRPPDHQPSFFAPLEDKIEEKEHQENNTIVRILDAYNGVVKALPAIEQHPLVLLLMAELLQMCATHSYNAFCRVAEPEAVPPKDAVNAISAELARIVASTSPEFWDGPIPLITTLRLSRTKPSEANSA